MRLLKRRDERCDAYTGTRDELLAAGLVPDGMFPGEPGMPLASVDLWPRNDAASGGPWWRPGRLRVARLMSGKFTASIVVSEEEQQRRIDRKAEEQRAWHKRLEEEREQERAEAAAGASLQTIIEVLGLQRVRERVEVEARSLRRGVRPQHLRLVWAAPASRTGR